MITITEQHLKLASIEAYRNARLFRVPLDEAKSCAYLALVKCSHTFDPTRGATFETWFMSCVRWASFDEYRLLHKKQDCHDGVRKWVRREEQLCEFQDVYIDEQVNVETKFMIAQALEDLYRYISRPRETGKRNLRILKFILRGMEYKQIALLCGTSKMTVCRVGIRFRRWKLERLERFI